MPAARQAVTQNKCKKKKPPQQPPMQAFGPNMFQPLMQQPMMPQVSLGMQQFAQQQFFSPPISFQAGQSSQAAPLGAAPPVTVSVGGSEPVVESAVDGSGVVAAGKVKTKKAVCWKCSVNTHATKDCTALHYCLVCDNTAHPTLRCPTVRLPRPAVFYFRVWH